MQQNIETRVFPRNFLLGSSTSSYQVEGYRPGQPKNDWHFILPESAIATGIQPDWWDINRFEGDIHLLVDVLGLNTQKMSIAWERVMPEPGRIDKSALSHYRQMVDYLKSKGVYIILAANHFAIPEWLAKQGSWENPEIIDEFAHYSEVLADNFGDVKTWLTINEPTINGLERYLGKRWYPQKSDPRAFLVTADHMVKAHQKAYEIFKRVIPGCEVGFPQFIFEPKPYNPHSLLDNLVSKLVHRIVDESFLDRLDDEFDFLGMNFFTDFFFKFNPLSPLLKQDPLRKAIVKPPFIDVVNPEGYVDDRGWPIVPDLFQQALTELYQKYRKPILISENGLADNDDRLRGYFLVSHLLQVRNAIKNGVEVRGYCYWSSVDQWDHEDQMESKFGIIHTNQKTGERKLVKSAYVLKEAAEQIKTTGDIDIESLAEKYLMPKQRQRIRKIAIPSTSSIDLSSKNSDTQFKGNIRDLETIIPDPLLRVLRLGTYELFTKRFADGKIANIEWQKIIPPYLLEGQWLKGDPQASDMLRYEGFRYWIDLVKKTFFEWKKGYILEPDVEKEVPWCFGYFTPERGDHLNLCSLKFKGPVMILAGNRDFKAFAVDAHDGHELGLKILSGLKPKSERPKNMPLV